MADREHLIVTKLTVERIEAEDFELTNSSWDDLRFPAQGIRPPGQITDPDIETDTGFFLFDAGGTEIIAGIAQMPHAWKEGTAVDPHVHWQKTTSAAGNVLWQIDYEVINVNDVAVMDYGSQNQSATVNTITPDDNTAHRALITDIGDIDMTGKTFSSLILWKISRIGGDVLDTYGADARLLEFDFHYQIDSLGSDQEYSQT